MLLRTTIKVSVKSLLANKMRTLLATLGIIIGVAAVIAMLSLGEGARRGITQRVTRMGTNLMILRPGQSGQHGVQSGTHQNLTLADAEAVLNKVPEIEQLSPVVRASAQIKYRNRNTQAVVTGGAVTYFPIRNFVVQRGRRFLEAETRGQARLAVIGSQTAEDLFGKLDPIGRHIKINGINFRIIGLLESKGDQGWFNPDNQVLIPYTTAMKRLFGLDHLHSIDIQLNQEADPEKAKERISSVMRHQHRLFVGSPDDFTIRSQAELLNTMNSITLTFTILLGGIASISLLVGGIGIMNIMLVTVTERTREIGIRKALGARNADVLKQFLIESVVISLLGGLLGIFLGVGACYLIDYFSSFKTAIQTFPIALAFGFSAVVGIFFGFYPAMRAARLDPIEALRYE